MKLIAVQSTYIHTASLLLLTGCKNRDAFAFNPLFRLSSLEYIFLLVLVFILIVIVFYVIGLMMKSKALAEMKRHEKKYEAELIQPNLEIFSDVPHEIITPLALIIGPLSNMINDSIVDPALKKKLKDTKKNITLINQLLDFRNIEIDKGKLKVQEGNICKMLRDLRESFSTISESNGIYFTIEMSEADQMIWFDYPKVEMILVLLLSNAFKFADKGDSIILSAKVVIKDEKPKLTFLVANTEKGNYWENKEEIGILRSGIGLASVHSLVTLHRGEIIIESKVEKGLEFLVCIPVSKADFSEDELCIIYPQDSTILDFISNVPTSFTLKKKKKELNKSSILVIDDNIELLEFIRESLHNSYSVYIAENGKEGLKMVQEIIPELIVFNDVMMPGKNSLELLEKIKTEASDIPIILLTVKTGMGNHLEGLKKGADVYIEKPFFPHILEQNILNILNTRKNLIERVKKNALILQSEITHTDSDRVFLENLTALIKENIDKPGLDISFVTTNLGISRSLLHLKLKKITGCSATEFVRSVRLTEAFKLITEGRCNISEAAYLSGFSSPAYFTRRFKEYFGKSPKAYCSGKWVKEGHLTISA